MNWDYEKETVEQYRVRRIKERGPIFNSICEILFQCDPVGLNFDENIDEYEGEAILIEKELNKIKNINDLSEIINSIFTQQFTEKIGSENKYKQVVNEIWNLINS
jgi:hypothetical protein